MNNITKETLIEFLVLAGRRALWTFAEVIVAMVPIGLSVGEIEWPHILGVAVASAIVSLCKSILVSMPEFGQDGELMIDSDTCQLNLDIDEQTIKSKKNVVLKVVPDSKK